MKRRRFVVTVALAYPRGRRESLKHTTRWLWWARLIEWSYYYGTIFMPLAGGAYVVDVIITLEKELS